MPRLLLDRCQHDSVSEFRLAARERYADGLTLAEHDRRVAAIYIWGYAVEMLIKAAYFTVMGYKADDPLSRNDLKGASALRKDLSPVGAPLSGFHDLAGWADLLILTRAALPGWGYPDLAFAGEVARRCEPLDRVWSESLRYHKNDAYLFEVARVREAVVWFLANADLL